MKPNGEQEVEGICCSLAITTKHYPCFLIADNNQNYLPYYFLDILCKNDNIKDCRKILTQTEKRK